MTKKTYGQRCGSGGGGGARACAWLLLTMIAASAASAAAPRRALSQLQPQSQPRDDDAVNATAAEAVRTGVSSQPRCIREKGCPPAASSSGFDEFVERQCSGGAAGGGSACKQVAERGLCRAAYM